MARQIIILGVFKQTDNSTIVSGVFWLIPPAALVKTNISGITLLPPSTAVNATQGVSWGYTAAELTSIQSGNTVEQSFQTGAFPSGTTVVAIETVLQNNYAAAQTILNNTAPASHFIGASWDGTSWAAAP